MHLEGAGGIANCPNFSILNDVENKFDIAPFYVLLLKA